jgi:microsomal dipeptidase-like Zn-dependent dipeptidase
MNPLARITRRLAALTLAVSAALGLSGAAQAVDGYVDLHAHLGGEMSFGGGWFWGTINGPMQTAVRRCDGNFLTRSHAATIFPILSELVGNYKDVDGNKYEGDTGWHLGKRNGWDPRRCIRFLGIPIPGTCPTEHFKHWPMWNAIAHQQMWRGWLQQAHDNGLQLTMVSLAESNFLCLNTANRRFDCDEMNSVVRQANFVRDFANANASWVGIAESPAQARALIAQGKLALVLSVEVTKLFPNGDYLAQLDQLRGLGVRSVQVMHHADNRFGGAAPIPKLMETANQIELLWTILSGGLITDITDIDEMRCRNSSGQSGDCDGEHYVNERGLSTDGVQLVNAMMDRGMLIDVSHESRRSFVDTYNIAMTRSAYPLIYSHVHTWNTIDPREERHEKYLRPEEIHMINDTGGMIGLRPGPEHTTTYNGTVSNQCQGTARSFAQSLMYAVDNGMSVGFGSDFNGFIQQLRPRWDFNRCFFDYFDIRNAGGPNELQRKGLAHVGLLPALMNELRTIGTPPQYLANVNQSAEKFLQIWERSVSLGTQSGNNLAREAAASASSTYCSVAGTEHCYSPARTNDGDRSTLLGGFHSWANNAGQAMPQWLRLEWQGPRTFSRIEFYTTQGYELRNFIIEYQPTFGGPYVALNPTPAFPTNNTSAHVSFAFAPVSAHSVRVMANTGSALQPGYARINEIEVYP